ncbi:hypothetical protein QSJ18_11545 [Gordonia sp. ABSL1-1]|uniref:hypothetical protein n=1 Tax=Gordonia sp. ABSL1-1 TaxID=3053923 RepID=UPI002574530A|nr:hypothetical protein [Gordonia sp. ABSL1-1]MDL9937379.1 hypothetical protein [Gordonia sp. ABSL1-1]
MTTDDEHAAGEDPAGADSGDPVRELLLTLANQIDQIAMLFGGGRGSGPTVGFGGLDSVGVGLADVSGEISGLFSEIGDLLARLLAALIAVLESIAAALRSDPIAPQAPRQYEPIEVRISPGDRSAGGPDER